MSKVKSWTQCRFRKGNPEHYVETVAWIDSTAAKIGNRVELLSLDEEFWEIISVGHTQDKNPNQQHKTFNNNI